MTVSQQNLADVIVDTDARSRHTAAVLREMFPGDTPVTTVTVANLTPQDIITPAKHYLAGTPEFQLWPAPQRLNRAQRRAQRSR